MIRTATINWEGCQRADGSYSLQTAARMTGCKITEDMDAYLSLIEEIRPVTSRQIAALAVATALALYQSNAAPLPSTEEKP